MRNTLFFAVLFLVINSQSILAQETDYCFRSKSDWNEIHQIVCFEANCSLEIGLFAAENLQKNYVPLKIFAEGEEPKNADGYYLTEYKGARNGITRVVVEIVPNVKIVVGYLPYVDGNFDKIRIVSIVKTSGESQLLFDGILDKEKVNTNDNSSLYKLQFTSYPVLIEKKSKNLKIGLLLENGVIFKRLVVGSLVFQN